MFYDNWVFCWYLSLKDNFCWLQVFRGIWEKDSTGWNGEDGGDMAVFFLCYAQTLLGCPFVSLPDFLYLEPYPWRAKKDWHWIHWNNMWKLQERLDFSFTFLNNDVLPTPLDKIFLSSNSVMTLSPTFPMFQVLHQVVILIFYWPTQISPQRRRSRYFHTVGLEKMFLLLLFLIPFWFYLVILFAFFFSPNSCMQLLIIWSPLGLSQTLCPKETPSIWWGLCLCLLICWTCFFKAHGVFLMCSLSVLFYSVTIYLGFLYPWQQFSQLLESCSHCWEIHAGTCGGVWLTTRNNHDLEEKHQATCKLAWHLRRI